MVNKFKDGIAKATTVAKKTVGKAAVIAGMTTMVAGSMATTSCSKDDFGDTKKDPVFVNEYSVSIETKISKPDDFEFVVDLVYDSISNTTGRFNSWEYPVGGEYFYKSDVKIHSETMEVNVNSVRTLVHFDWIFEMKDKPEQWQTYMTLFIDPKLKLLNLNLDKIRKDYEEYEEWAKHNDFANYHTWDDYYNSVYKRIIENIKAKGYKINIVYHSKSAENSKSVAKKSTPPKGSIYVPPEFYSRSKIR